MTMLIAIALMIVLQIFTPFWWWIMVVPFVMGLVRSHSGWEAFRMGLISGGCVWFVAGLVLLLSKSQIIATRIAQMAGLGSGWAVLAATATVAILSAGIAGATGFSLRAAIRLIEKQGS